MLFFNTRKFLTTRISSVCNPNKPIESIYFLEEMSQTNKQNGLFLNNIYIVDAAHYSMLKDLLGFSYKQNRKYQDYQKKRSIYSNLFKTLTGLNREDLTPNHIARIIDYTHLKMLLPTKVRRLFKYQRENCFHETKMELESILNEDWVDPKPKRVTVEFAFICLRTLLKLR